jgi:hypothetical protein
VTLSKALLLFSFSVFWGVFFSYQMSVFSFSLLVNGIEPISCTFHQT